MNWPITNHLPMIKHLFKSHHMCFILSDLKCYGSVPCYMEIIFEVQRKMSNKKITRRKKKLSNVFFVFYFHWTASTFKPHNFLIHFKWFKVLQELHLKFYKPFWNFNNNKATYKEFFECLGFGLCNVQWIVFLSFWPLYFGRW